MLRIWGRNNSINVQKVMWAVAELGLEHERSDAGGEFGGLDTAEYGAMNPNRLVPVLKDGDTAVWESNAVVRYLAARYGAGNLWPEDPARRSEADRWMDWQLTTLQPAIGPVFMGLVRTPPERRDMASIQANAERLGQAMRVLDGHMAGRPYVAGDRLTMGDVPVGCVYWRYVNLDIARPDLPNLEPWFQSLKARDAYRRNVMIPVT
jgi:glutathione S-transferase